MSEQNWKRYLWWLSSRKVQTALAVVLVAILKQAGLGVSEEVVLAVIATGTAIVLGIAIEDAGEKSGGGW